MVLLDGLEKYKRYIYSTLSAKLINESIISLEIISIYYTSLSI